MQHIRRLIVLLLVFAALSVAGIYGVYRASQSVPDFYELALQQHEDVADKAGDELERKVVQMASELEEGRNWQLILTDEHINGWLATDLEQKFPNLLPKGVHEPRVAFQDQVARVACRLDTGKVLAVLSLELEAYLTEQPNEIAVHVQNVRAGMLPVPLTRILDHVAEAARQSGLSLRWTQQDGDPVALVALPVEQPELRSGVVIERLEVRDGSLTVSGTADSAPDQPRFAESTDEASKNQR